MALVKMPDGAIVDIPDDASDELLIQLGILQAPQEPPNMGARLMRQLGLTARAGIRNALALPSMGGDAIAAASNALLGTRFPNQTEAVQRLLTQLGLPEPESEMEEFAQVGASLLAPDPLSKMAVGKLAGKAPLYQNPLPIRSDPKTQAITEAQRHGIAVTPSEAGAGPLGQTVEFLAGRGGVERQVQQHNVKAVNALSKKAIGLPKDAPLDANKLSEMMDDVVQQTYEPIKNLGSMPVMPGYKKAITDLQTKHGILRSFPSKEADEAAKLAKQFDVKGFRGEDALEAIKTLRDNAGGAFRTGKDELGRAQRAIASALETNIDDFLHSQWGRNRAPAGVVDAFRQGRVALAKQHALGRAMNETTGDIDARKLGSMIHKKKPLTDELALLGHAAQAAPKSLSTPNAHDPLLEQGSKLFGLASAASGNFPWAAIPLVRMGAQRFIPTPSGQKLLAQPAITSALPSQWPATLPKGLAALQGLFE